MLTLVLALGAASGVEARGEGQRTGSVAAGPDVAAQSRPSLARASASSLSRTKLRRKLERLAGQAPGRSGFYVHDLDADRRPVLFDRKPGRRRKLASNTKLFTTATALDRLGPSGRIETRAQTGGRIGRGGRLHGNLFLVGGGDPSLGKGGLRGLAKAVKRAGVKRIKGRVYADDSVFDRKRGVPDSNFGPSAYFAPLSGLVYGGSTYSGDPAVEAGIAFKKALRKRGVKVGGRVKRKRLPKRARGDAPVAVHGSPRILSLVKATNKPSDNFFAEMLLKRLWAEPGRRGTTKGGTTAVERFARSVGSKVDARDGSGLTRNNRSSPRAVVRLLGAMQAHEAGRPFYRSLPSAGSEGTLAGRMRGTAADGRCRAKTGTINGVSTLSGYCKAGHGKVAFSLLMNGVGSYDAARDIQDRMAVAIARYRP